MDFGFLIIKPFAKRHPVIEHAGNLDKIETNCITTVNNYQTPSTYLVFMLYHVECQKSLQKGTHIAYFSITGCH